MTIEERRAWVARRDPEKMRAYARKLRAGGVNWKRANPERAKEIERRVRERYPERMKARSAVTNALKSGRLQRGECIIGEDCEGRIEAHHADYSKPLDVSWVCKKHHEEIHLQREAVIR